MEKTFTQELKVAAEHLDNLNHVNNVVYLQWAQDIAGKHWLKSCEKFDLEKLVWVARDHHIEYFAPALLNQRLRIKTFVEKMDGVSSFRIVEVYCAEKLLCKCRSRWILVDKNSMRPRRIPQEICQLFI
jgi:acyl-CoA thioester hydrolase